MDILFLNSHRMYLGKSTGNNFGMQILAQILKKLGYETEIFAGYAEQTLRKIDDLSRSGNLPKVIGFYCDFLNYRWIELLGGMLEEKYSSIHLIAGGPQTAGFDATFLKKSKIEVACIGEADDSLPELMEYILRGTRKLEEIKGISYLNDRGELCVTPPSIPKLPLDDMPWPELPETEAHRGDQQWLSLMTGRGCPFKCSFCYEGANAKNVRLYSPTTVLNEIERNFKRNPNIKFINFIDDTFTIDKNRVFKICDGLERLHEQYDFACFADAHIETIHKNPEMNRPGLRGEL